MSAMGRYATSEYKPGTLSNPFYSYHFIIIVKLNFKHALDSFLGDKFLNCIGRKF